MAEKRRRNPFEEGQDGGSGHEVLSITELKKRNKGTREIPIKDIEDPNWHDRSIYDKEAIKNLSVNIQETNGGKLLHPILVKEMKKGRYQRIAGFRRIEAYKLLERTTIPAVILPESTTEEQSIKIMLSENIQREGVSPFDQTKSIVEYIRVILGLETTQETIAELYRMRNLSSGNIKGNKELLERKGKLEELTKRLVNISLSSLISRLEVYKMDESITEALRNREIVFSTAHLLHKIKDKDKLKEVLEAAKRGLTTKELQEMIHPQRERVRVKGEKITLGVSLSKRQRERLKEELERILEEILKEAHN